MPRPLRPRSRQKGRGYRASTFTIEPIGERCSRPCHSGGSAGLKRIPNRSGGGIATTAAAAVI